MARVFAMCEGVRGGGRGRPLAELVRVLATFRRFLREGTPWRSLRASEAEVSGATLRRRLTEWTRTDLLWQVHVTLVGLLRGHPDLILDSCSVRAKRGGDLTGRNPTDRGKRGTKYHVAVDGRGVPVACAVTGANVPDTVLFKRLFAAAFAVIVRLRTVFADKGYDAEANRDLCRRSGAEPCIHTRGQPHGSGLGQRRWPVERSLAWLLENKRLDRRYDRKGFIVEALLRGACIFTAVSKLIQEFIEETATKSSNVTNG
jgi:transposase